VTLASFLSSTLFSPVVSAIAALLGAIIGGIFVLAAQGNERRNARRSATRALALELLTNCHAIKAFALTVSNNPGRTIGPGLFPKVVRCTFDQNLPLIARFLKFDDLRRVAAPYSGGGYGAYVMLDALISNKPQPLDQVGLDIVNSTSIMFLDALEVLKEKVLTKKEAKQFENEGIGLAP
jgi:hypothetical protein